MREIMRSMARHHMREAGVGGMNRKHVVKLKDGRRVTRSFFAGNWREWVLGNPNAKPKKRKRQKKA